MFLIVGAILGFVLKESSAVAAIIVISIAWMFIYGPWAIATFIELLLGYALVKYLKER